MTSIKRFKFKRLLHGFYERFILKDSRYIGYTPCEYLCDGFILSFILKYSRKRLSEETIQQVEDNGTVMGFNDDHLVKYLCLNIIDRKAYNPFIIEDVYEKVHKAFGNECSCFTLYFKSIRYIKWALCKKDSTKCWMSKYVKNLSPMGTLDTYSYNMPNDLREGIINKELFLPKPEPITITQYPLENIDINKLFEELSKEMR